MSEAQSAAVGVDPGPDALCAALSQMAVVLAGAEQGVDDGVRVDRIRLLEGLKSAVAAAQVRETAALAESQRAVQLAAGVPAGRAGRGVAGQVGLARRVSPYHAARYVGWARILVSELPATFAALQRGEVSEWRAMIVARETAWLCPEHRREVDRRLAPDLSGWGDGRVEGEVKRLAYALDPEGFVDRLRGAAQDRRVTLRPAPDTMARLGSVLPVAQGVAAYAALGQVADTVLAAGDPRSRGQIMADTLVERLTGQARAEQVAVEVALIMSEQALLDGGTEPGQLVGYGPIPAQTARDLALDTTTASDTTTARDTTASDTEHQTDEQAEDERAGAGAGERAGAGAPRWLRRLYTRGGRLIAMESRRRCFTPAQRQFITLRDQTCRTPWCGAQIRHADHVLPAEHGGPTHVTNGQGYCAACNYTRQAPGWHASTPTGDAGDEVMITTPTGHTYRSRPPDPPGTERRPAARSPDQERLAQRQAKRRAA